MINIPHVSKIMVSFVMVIGFWGCSPSLNWRQVTVGELSVLLPCKPDRATRDVTLGNKPVQMTMAGCEAEGVLFAVSFIPVANLEQRIGIMSEWKQISLNNIKRSEVQNMTPARIKPTIENQYPTRWDVKVKGENENGSEIQARLEWFIVGNKIYHKAAYGQHIRQEQIEPLFEH